MKVLESMLKKDAKCIVSYIDARTLGSTSQYTDTNIPLKNRCTCLFRDILIELYNVLLEYIADYAPGNANDLLRLLDDFGKIASEPVIESSPQSLTRESRVDTKGSGGMSAKFQSSGVEIASSSVFESGTEEKESLQVQLSQTDKIIFPAVRNSLGPLLRDLNATLFILIDEWSSLPYDLQPFLAEFFKRCFLPEKRITIKIAALEYRSNFGVRNEHDIVGFELGSDISTALDIDDYFVYDRNREMVGKAFGEMLFKHLSCEVPEAFLTGLRVKNFSTLISRMFTESPIFGELVRASEGVARDLINIFSTAFFDAQRRGRDSIDRKAIIESARQWFEKDKAQNLDDALRQALQRIIGEVIGTRKARSFLVPRELQHHPLLERLFDARVLHLMQRGYADKDKPGIRYNIYTLDYGTYVDLLNTTKQPELDFQEFQGQKEMVVPFDDKRSIRRIVLEEKHLTEVPC